MDYDEGNVHLLKKKSRIRRLDKNRRVAKTSGTIGATCSRIKAAGGYRRTKRGQTTIKVK